MGKTTTATCMCGTVEVRVQGHPADGTTRCNCGFCQKRGWWSMRMGPDAVEVIRGADMLTTPEENSYWQGYTCKGCGAVVYGTMSLPTPGTSVNVRLLDDVDLHGVPVLWLDGAHDTWAPLGTYAHHQPEPIRRTG